MIGIKKQVLLNKRTIYLCLLLIILINLLLRYPIIPHQQGADGFMNVALTKYIIQDGYSNWQLSIFSSFGLSSFSYPVSIQFIFASLSQLGGISIELSVLIFGFVLGITSIFVGYVAVKEFTKDSRLGLLGAFLFSTMPIFLQMTKWSGSSRPLLMIFLLLTIILLQRVAYAKKTEQESQYSEIKYTFLTILFLIIMWTVHRMAIFAIFILISYMFSRPILKIYKLMKIKIGLSKWHRFSWLSYIFYISWVTILALFIIAQIIDVGILGSFDYWTRYQHGFLFSGSSPFIILLNMVIDYWSAWGILSIFMLFGSIYLFVNRHKHFKFFFFIFSLLLITPLATLGLYTELILILFLIPIVVIGFAYFIKTRFLVKYVTSVTIVLLIVSCAFSGFMSEHWFSQEEGLTEQEYDIALYSNELMTKNDVFVSNSNVFGNKIISFSDVKFLTEKFPYPLIYRWVTKDVVSSNLDWETMLKDRTIEVKYPEELVIVNDHRFILLHDVDASSFVRSIYGVNYVIEGARTTFIYAINESLYETRYITFGNGVGRIWYLGV